MQVMKAVHLRAVAAALLYASPLFAATYYIDSATGIDTNTGMSTTAAWAHAPGMTGCAKNCLSHVVAPGDQFRFKGGSIWNSSSLPLTVGTSGQSGSPIYYGVNTSWFSGTNSGSVNTNGTQVIWASGNAFYPGSAWANGAITINGANYTIASVQGPYSLTLTTSAGSQSGVSYSNSLFQRPIFNNGFANGNDAIHLNSGVSYITIDSIEITGVLMTDAGSGASINIGGATNGNILIENMDIHNWNRCTGSGTPVSACTGAVTDNSFNEGGIYAAMYSGLSPANMIVQYSNIGDPENGGNIGSATRGIQTLIGNYLHDTTQACLHGCQLVHDNVVARIGNSFDPSEHGNIFYSDMFTQGGNSVSTATAYIYNNWIIDTQTQAADAQLYPNPGSSDVISSVSYYIFNNVISCTSANGCVTISGTNVDPFGLGSQTVHIYDWNNTYNLLSASTCVLVTNRGLSISSLDVRNLHCIQPSGGTLVNPVGTITYTDSNMLLQTTSTANGQGYAAPVWGPANGGTVGAGTNLSANCTGSLSALCNSTTLGGTIASPPPRGATWDIGAYSFSTSQVTLSPPSSIRAVVH